MESRVDDTIITTYLVSMYKSCHVHFLISFSQMLLPEQFHDWGACRPLAPPPPPGSYTPMIIGCLGGDCLALAE